MPYFYPREAKAKWIARQGVGWTVEDKNKVPLYLHSMNPILSIWFLQTNSMRSSGAELHVQSPYASTTKSPSQHSKTFSLECAKIHIGHNEERRSIKYLVIPSYHPNGSGERIALNTRYLGQSSGHSRVLLNHQLSVPRTEGGGSGDLCLAGNKLWWESTVWTWVVLEVTSRKQSLYLCPSCY